MRFAAAEGLNVANLRVTSWNMFKGALEGWQGELDDLDAPNTLFLMQEALQGAALFGAMGAGQRWHFSPGYESQSGLSGVMTTAAVNAVERCRLKHKEPWLRSPKASLVTRYRLQNTSETLLVANIHAINFTFGTKAYERQLDDVVEVVRSHSGPMIFAGDFNTWSKRRQRILDGVISELGLQPVPYDISLIKQVFGNPLDHIYFRDLSLLQASVRATAGSDHNVLTASFDYTVGL